MHHRSRSSCSLVFIERMRSCSRVGHRDASVGWRQRGLEAKRTRRGRSLSEVVAKASARENEKRSGKTRTSAALNCRASCHRDSPGGFDAPSKHTDGMQPVRELTTPRRRVTSCPIVCLGVFSCHPLQGPEPATVESISIRERYLFSIGIAIKTCVILLQLSPWVRQGWCCAVSRQGIERADRVQAIDLRPQPCPCATQRVAARRMSPGGAAAAVGSPWCGVAASEGGTAYRRTEPTPARVRFVTELHMQNL